MANEDKPVTKSDWGDVAVGPDTVARLHKDAELLLHGLRERIAFLGRVAPPSAVSIDFF